MSEPIQEYILKRDVVCQKYGRYFLLEKGARCKYFAHSDTYLFDAQDNYVPYFERAIIEQNPKYFRPVRKVTR